MKTICSRQLKHVLTDHFESSGAFSKPFALLLFVAVLTVPNLVMGQAGTLDPTFGNNGIVTTANTGASGATLQSDGKIVVAGSIFQQGGLLRYNTNGTLDSTFGNGGEVLIGNSNTGEAFAVAVQTDGKILAAAPSSIRLTVFRFNSNGTVDNSFGTNGSETITAAGFLFAPVSGGLALQPDGKILVATGDVVARLLTNGQLDSTFGSNGLAPTVGGESIAFLPVQNSPLPEILLGVNGVASLYRRNGSLDGKFGVNGQTPGFASDGSAGFVVFTDPMTNLTKIITVGTITTSPSLTFAQTVSGFLLVRYNSDGTIDNSFGSHGAVATPFPGNILSQAFAVAVQANGDIVAAGQTALTDVHSVGGPSDFALARYNPNGSIDTTFGNGGFVSTAFGSSEALANTVLIQTDGKIVAVGNSNGGTTIERYLGN